MNALQTILACNERGILVSVTDDSDLYVRPKERLTPELRAALRENKHELVNGKRDPVDRFEMLEIMPADGWWGEFLKGPKGKKRFEIQPLAGWALVLDRYTGYKTVMGITVDDWGGPVCEDDDFVQYVRPDQVEERREELFYTNRAIVEEEKRSKL